VKINPEEWCVDVEAKVCLREGLLELVACTKDTKEHESLVVVEAKPSHIHRHRGHPPPPTRGKATFVAKSRGQEEHGSRKLSDSIFGIASGGFKTRPF
jgi:hypothetical protein